MWALLQEPPTEFNKPLHKGIPAYHRIFTQDTDLASDRYYLSQPALPWHLDKTYDDLVKCDIPTKQRNLSWVTSNLNILRGHRKRMKFLEQLRQAVVEFDLFGRGFNYINNKWDGIAPYKYSLAIENCRNEYYWSEKIADCFLSWTMPIYYGCTRIHNYFPSEAMVNLDTIEGSDVIEKVKTVIASDLWRKNLDAIEFSRNLILDKYQLFTFITASINAWETSSGAGNDKIEDIYIPALPVRKPKLTNQAKLFIKSWFPGLSRLLINRKSRP